MKYEYYTVNIDSKTVESGSWNTPLTSYSCLVDGDYGYLTYTEIKSVDTKFHQLAVL